jgi:phosphoribosylaminoimidazolecarboxamide formyltransferase/IMP cyclohydrolase
MSMNVVEQIDDQIKISRVLVSVSDKQKLETFIPGLRAANPEIKFFSTGGTYTHIRKILGPDDAGLMQVSEFTGQPETQGGLVKTLDFKIYLGLLTETYNEDHQQDMKRTGAVPIDMVVVNLYPFKETISRKNVTVENARGNIDIGGPCMIRASAKNLIRVASVVDPEDYDLIVSDMKKTGGTLSLRRRFALARKAFAHTAEYDRTIADYLAAQSYENVSRCYRF